MTKIIFDFVGGDDAKNKRIMEMKNEPGL